MIKILIENLSKTLDNIHTLDNINLKVKHNEFVAILGPSGCGKSTLLNIVSGLLVPEHGEVWIDGENWTGRTGRVSYMQQKDLLLPWHNILDNISMPLILKGLSKREANRKAEAYLKDFGLQGFAGYYPGQLSGGMRQRAALLRTYLFASDVLLLDEPFASLDAINRRKMQLWLKDLCKNYQLTVLLVTHDIEEALLLADRIYVFSARPAGIKLELDLSGNTTAYAAQMKQDILMLLEKEACK